MSGKVFISGGTAALFAAAAIIAAVADAAPWKVFVPGFAAIALAAETFRYWRETRA
jgi:hypothetical protein